MVKRRPTTDVSEAEVRTCLRKAAEFLEGARSELAKENWNSAGMLAVHAAISASDALSGFLIGIRSTSQDHRDAATLIKSMAVKDAPDLNRQADRLARIIARKNLVAYEGRELSQADSAYLVEQAGKFLGWVRNKTP